ncbi:hypothetical protein GP486_004915 [Trichoglossum hirsutum]|uniref:Uncharacterized protein n=1 Tax=Trichoglossum hirsutum TaxID=265104 RepID=A0A9P8RNS3_9PEZI|nr:hypothetical protein GP486_004915 [Trichoglossum hirsutum]
MWTSRSWILSHSLLGGVEALNLLRPPTPETPFRIAYLPGEVLSALKSRRLSDVAVMSWLDPLRRLYSLDTLDTRFTTASSIPPKPLEPQREDRTNLEDSVGKGARNVGDGLPPSRWGTLEFYVYYIVFIICVPLMFKAAIEVSQGQSVNEKAQLFKALYYPTVLQSHPNYPKYSHLLSPGWIPGRKVDNSDAQYSTFRENVPYLFLVLTLHPLLRRLYESCTSSSDLGYNSLAKSDSDQASGRGSPLTPTVMAADARLNRRISFDIVFAFLFICALHGFSAFKILLILYINYSLATRLPRQYIPVATWIFNIGILFANELCKGYRFTAIAEFFLPWSAASREGVEQGGAAANWGAWLDSYGGLIPRWEILFNITVLRLISFNLDYYWSLSMRGSSPIEVCQPAISIAYLPLLESWSMRNETYENP